MTGEFAAVALAGATYLILSAIIGRRASTTPVVPPALRGPRG